MRRKMRRCLVPVGGWDFSWYTGSDPSWYAVVWLTYALSDWKPNSSIVLRGWSEVGKWEWFKTHTQTHKTTATPNSYLSFPFTTLCLLLLFSPCLSHLFINIMIMWWQKRSFSVFIMLHIPALSAGLNSQDTGKDIQRELTHCSVTVPVVCTGSWEVWMQAEILKMCQIPLCTPLSFLLPLMAH